MKQDHRPWDEKTFQAGANTDADGAIVGRTPGQYRDARNLRLADNSGDNGSLHKIGGERVAFSPDQPGAESYRCVGAIEVKGHQFTIWASILPQYPPLITIDGITMVMSFDLPYVATKKLQLHKSEDCQGGRVFDARSGAVPLHWDVQNIIDAHAQDLQTYFADFDLTTVQVNPTRPVNRPVFTGFKDLGGGAGVDSGQIWYVMRYVNATGDHTPDGPILGPVMVPTRDKWEESAQVPSAGVVGAGPLDLDVATGLGVKLRFRTNNKANFDSLEILRLRWTDQGGVDAPPVIEVAYRMAVAPAENNVYDIVDDGTTLEAIATDDAALTAYYIKAANSVRYVDYRVLYGGVTIAGQDVQGSFIDDEGARTFPFTKNIGTAGHADAVNHCYHRRFQSGERHGVGIVYYGPNGGQSFVQHVEDDVLLPSRRTPKTGVSLAESDAPCFAADIYGQVGPTFEVFDHDHAIGKSQTNPLVNIMIDGRRRQGGWASDSVLAGSPAGIGEDGVYTDTVPYGPWYKSSWLKPLTPVGPNDLKWGLDYRVNTKVHPSGLPNATDAGAQEYDPKVWGVTHHALGLGFTGLQTPPPGQQGFSMVATPPAGRVVTQAFLKWKLNPATDDTPVSKDLYTAHVCLPDFNSGVVNQAVWEGLQNNPGNYKVQCVSPLGFSTEQYGSVMSAAAPYLDLNELHIGGFSDLADLLSVARVLWDTGQINPGNNGGGFSPASPLPDTAYGQPDHFAGFGGWRNQPGTWPLANGDSLFGIQSAQELIHQSGVRSLIMTFDAQLYHTTTAGIDFNSTPVRDFEEPWYVINIIQEGKKPETTQGYMSCNHYQAFVSEIGICDGSAEQTFSLVDERWEDVRINGVGDERYVFLRSGFGVQRYLNAGGFPDDVADILAAIADDGFWTAPSGVLVQGLYSTTEDSGILYIQFIGVPPVGATVEVRYDKRIPVKFYGDMVTAPALATLMDAAATANPPNGLSAFFSVGTQSGSNNSIPAWPIRNTGWFNFGGALITNGSLPVPFCNYEYNGRYMVPFGLGFGVTGVDGVPGGRMAVNQIRSGSIMSIRQWKVLVDMEMRAPVFLSRYEQFVSSTVANRRSWPNVNFIPRPYNFTSGGPQASGVFPNYGDNGVYGPTAQNDWRFGGIQSAQLPSTDHDLVPAVRYFAKPDFGYQEEEEQCSALIWSAKDSPLLQDSPGLKTFPVNNTEFIPNEKGGIQRLYSSSPGNVFVETDGATYEVLVEKSTAYSVDGTAFSLFAQDNFVGQVIARSTNIGMPGDTWKTAAEGAPFTGAKTQADALMWYNGTSAYMLVGSTVVDIAVGTYRKGLADAYAGDLLNRKGPISAAYDTEKNELWISMGGTVCVYNASSFAMVWQGQYEYRFDELLFAGGKMYGMRGLTTFVLDTGDLINGELTRASVTVPSAPFPSERMQWLRVKAVSPRKPKRIEWYDENNVLVTWMDEPTFGPLYLKKETGWENWVPKKNVAVDPKHGRMQGGLAYYKVIWQEGGEDKVLLTGAQVKALK